MLTRLLLAAAFCLTGWAQPQPPITIAAGSPTDQYFAGGSVWAPCTPGQNPSTCWEVSLPPPLSFLRYGTSFKYDIPLPRGLYSIDVTVVEPNKTGPNQRLFTITANGQTTSNIDVFSATGGINVPLNVPMMALVGAGWLHLQFTAVTGNAIVSEIVVRPYPAVIMTAWETCTSPPTCAGLERVTIQKADGTTVQRIATPAQDAPAVSWAPVQ